MFDRQHIQRPAIRRLIEDQAAFLRAFGERQVLLMRPEDPPVELLSLEIIDELLSCSLLKVPFGNLTDVRGNVPVASFTRTLRTLANNSAGHIDGNKVIEQMKKGRTLVLSGLEQWHAPVVRYLAEIAVVFPGTLLEGAAFITPPDAQGLPVHRDPGHLFIVQINGSKDWRVYTPPKNGYWHVGEIRDAEEIAFDGSLSPGDVLYLPAGTPHVVRGQTGLSVHLSLGVSEPPSEMILRAFKEQLVIPESVEPRPADDEALAVASSDFIEALVKRLENTDSTELATAARLFFAHPLPNPSEQAFVRWARGLDG